jgi:putative tryptophan/tyrosine transport system substrate-binding protein
MAGFAVSTPILEGDRSTSASLLLRRRAASIVTTGGPQPARAAQAATRTIPIVFLSGSDPVKDGLVKSFNRPGNNVTGVHVFTTSLGPKRLDLLCELLPEARVIAFLVNPTSQIRDMQVSQVEDAARTIGRSLIVVNASNDGEIDLAFATLAQRGTQALLMSADLFFQTRTSQLVALAARYKMPVMYEWPEFAAAGGLISYSTVRDDTSLQAGIYVGRHALTQVLIGLNPAIKEIENKPVVGSHELEIAYDGNDCKSEVDANQNDFQIRCG